MHLVQGNGSGIPHGEISCDIWTIVRRPAELLDQRPYYLLKKIKCDWKKHQLAIKELCSQAIEVRKSRRTCIIWLHDEIKKMDAN